MTSEPFHATPGTQPVLQYIAHDLSDDAVQRTVGSPEYQRLCRLLRQFREHAGLTQSDLAAQLDVTQGFVSDYERGQRRLDVFELRQIVAALGPAAEPVTALLHALDAVIAALGHDQPGATT